MIMSFYILRITTGEIYMARRWPEPSSIYFKTRKEAQDIVNILAQLQDREINWLPNNDPKYTISNRSKEEYEIVEAADAI